MPVSHIGLTVSHIPSATSFYLAALQPLGYRFIGHQSDSIGFGIEPADFFLSQSAKGTLPLPNHIAFLAEDRWVVRDCYAAALNAGGRPSGAPGYMHENCTCFNAAVEDLGGNTVEFVFRQEHGEPGCDEIAAASDHSSRIRDWRDEVGEQDAAKATQSVVSSGSQGSRISKAKSNMRTTMDLATTASTDMKPGHFHPGLTRAHTAPAKSDTGGRTLLGAAIGAAAGVALLYAMSQTEQKNARDEADCLGSTSSKTRPESKFVPLRSMTLTPAKTGMPSVAPSTRRSSAQVEKTATLVEKDVVLYGSRDKSSHRNHTTTESIHSTRRRPSGQDTHDQRMVPFTGYNNQDTALTEVLSHNDHHHPMPIRSKAKDVIDHARPMAAAKQEPTRSRHANALTVEPRSYNEPARIRSAEASSSNPPSSHRLRHNSVVEAPLSSTVQRHDTRRDSANDVRPSSSSSRPDSSSINTATYHPAAISLPGSSIFSRTSSRHTVLLPPSSSKSSKSTSQAKSKPESNRHSKDKRDSVPARPLEPLQVSEQSWENFHADTTSADEANDGESDGLHDDVRTVVPEDSISCVDFSEHKGRHRKRRENGKERQSGSGTGKESARSKTRSERSESTVRPWKESRQGSGLRKVFGLP